MKIWAVCRCSRKLAGVFLLSLTAGCALDQGGLRLRLEDEAPAVRVRTIREIARRQERDLVPALIDRLDDEDAAVRLYAILALEQLMGTRMGYAYSAPAEERRAAIEAWRHSLLDSARPTDQEAHRPVEPG